MAILSVHLSIYANDLCQNGYQNTFFGIWSPHHSPFQSLKIWKCWQNSNGVTLTGDIKWWGMRNFEIFEYTGWPRKKRPELSHGVMQHSRWSESAEKHVCNEQTSSNMSIKFHLKRFHISHCTREIVLHVIKQCLQAVHHLCCWLYAGYSRTSQ